MSLVQNKEQQNLALLDEEFLAALTEQKERVLYAKIIALNINEEPIDEIEGKISGGSINIDGTSAVRRTCSMTMVTAEVNINDYYWGLKTKFKLEIGLKNQLKNEFSPTLGIYPDIMWFPMGTFILASFNTSINTAGTINISLSGKDKMCMLNGELGGQLFASIDFGTEEVKTKVFKKVNNSLDPANSDVLMGKQYYIEYNEPQVEEDNAVLITDTNYSFGVDNAKGNWYLMDNKYLYDFQTSESEAHKYKGTHYFRYKRVNNPNDMFEPLTKEYEKSKYYFKKEENDTYYILNTTTQAKNTLNYQLKDLYSIDYEYSIKKINLEKIIREAVHAYAKEPYHNIVIEDVEKYGLEQVQWKGDDDLVVLRNVSTGHFTNMRLYNNFTVNGSAPDTDFIWYPLSEEAGGSDIGTYLKNVDGNFELSSREAYINSNENEKTTFYQAAKIGFGQDVGYRLTDLTYNGDLISSIGETLTSILDKIKNMLGDFEYFYDTDGRFIFRRKRQYVNTTWSHFVTTNDETYVTFSNDKRKFSFNFEGNRLLTAIQNTPVLTNLRNDFSVWGKRKSINGQDIPIHARFAIDRKPVFYRAFDGKIYTTDEKYTLEEKVITGNDEAALNLLKEQLNNFQFEHELTQEQLDTIFSNAEGVEQLAPSQSEIKGCRVYNGGWWDIEDWANYYKIFTGLEPHGTMKWYSHGKHESSIVTNETLEQDIQGCLPLSILNSNLLPNFVADDSQLLNNGNVWLIGVRFDADGNVISTLEVGHGYGILPSVGQRYRKQLYHKQTLVNQELVDEEFTEEEEKNKEKYFGDPYATCDVTHTYSWFKNRTSKNYRYYFYNPSFPGLSEEELINRVITEAYANKGVYVVDWREIIYRMALDYFAGQGCSEEYPLYLRDYNSDSEEPVYYAMTSPDDFLYEVGRRNEGYYPTGYTGYEQYYTDMQGFWRQLYNLEYEPQVVYEAGSYENSVRLEDTGFYTRIKTWKEESISDLVVDYYNNKSLNNLLDSLPQESTVRKDLEDKYSSYFVNTDDVRLGWNRAVFENPDTLNFWIDFLDEGEELSQFSVPQVGDRSKSINEDKVSAIIFKEIPDLILYDTHPNKEDTSQVPTKEDLGTQTGYTWIFLPKGFDQYLSISYRNLSAKNKIDELLYQYAYCIENISLTALPVYHLEPNTRIYVCDKKTGIEGEYLVSRIGFSLNYNGTMSITATKAPERLY